MLGNKLQCTKAAVVLWWNYKDLSYSKKSNLVTLILVTFGQKNEIFKCNLITKRRNLYENNPFIW